MEMDRAGWYWIADEFGNHFVGYWEPKFPDVFLVCGNEEVFPIDNITFLEYIEPCETNPTS